MGRPEFENQTLISAMTNKSIAVISGESVANNTTSSYERITLLSPPNTISRVFNLRLGWNGPDPGATSGTKQCIIDQQIDATTGIGLFIFSGNFNTSPTWDQGAWNTDVSGKNPNDLGAMSTQINSAKFDETKGIQMVFNHTMNVATTSKRHWVLFVEREVVAR